MKYLRSAGALVVVGALLAMAFASLNASAVERRSGDFWTYDMSMNVEGYTFNGTMTYTFVDTDTIIVGGTQYLVNVMKISGGGSQSLSFMSFEVSLALGGFVYETRDKNALVKSDLFMWMNMTFGIGSFQFVQRFETELSTTYSPGLLSGFDPEKTGPGDSWTETVTVTMTTTQWENGTMQGAPDTSTDVVSYNLVADSTMKTVTTGAGTFECLRVTATSDEDIVVYYWSNKVKNFVKEESYEPGADQPFSVMSLKDYKTGSGIATIMFVGIGIGILVIAIIVLALVVMKKRGPAAPAPPPPPPPQ